MSTAELITQADALLATDPKKAEELYKEVLASAKPSASSTDTSAQAQLLRDQEKALVKLGEMYRDQKNPTALSSIISSSRAFMSSTAKAKTAKLIRTLLDFFGGIEGSENVQKQTLQDNIDWAKKEKRIFLKHSLETRLAGLYLATQQYRPALALIDTLLTELKRLDDKLILTEVHLLESRVWAGVGNFGRAKASLTSARTAANAIYCPPLLQSSLDLQSGILHAEDKDYTTAYSYFYESFESLSSQGETEAGLKALKYMLLCKIMLGLPEEVPTLLQSKLAVQYTLPSTATTSKIPSLTATSTNSSVSASKTPSNGGPTPTRDLEAMRAIARAHQARNLKDFERALREFRNELSSDPTIRSHLAALYDTLLEQNLLRIIEPYSVVEISQVAELVGQDQQAVEMKLSQMILDKVFHGVLDQGRGCLLVFDPQEVDNMYAPAIETLEEVGKVVKSLYAKTVKIA